MIRRTRNQQTLPPLEWLRTFETAARLGNFTRAASELGLTQAAVSQQIRSLEGYLETSMFTRLARGVQLTVEGEAYAPHVRSSLFALRRSTSDLFSLSRQLVTIAAPASVITHQVENRRGTIIDTIYTHYPEYRFWV